MGTIHRLRDGGDLSARQNNYAKSHYDKSSIDDPESASQVDRGLRRPPLRRSGRLDSVSEGSRGKAIGCERNDPKGDRKFCDEGIDLA